MYKGLYDYIERVCEKLDDVALKESFRKCYLNTLETTVKYDENGEVFIITGDIEAMWLRDSSVQVSHYVRLCGEDEDCRKLVRDLLKRQFKCIRLDPYANAFNESANSHGHITDETEQNALVWERKYEIDSLIYPLWLLNKYYFYSKDSSVFDDEFFETYKIILETLRCEQDYANNSAYYFRRKNSDDTLANNGYGSDYKYTGMVRSAFRPSDDRCEYSFLIPSNMFITAVMGELCENLDKAKIFNKFLKDTEKLCEEIENGIKNYGIVETEEFGKIYAFETDGLGNSLLMDDANVPSLLSMPYMGYCDKDDEIYLNTRRFILSKSNPYYYEGKCARGVGSPHTKAGNIWHIALVIEALTTDSKEEIKRIFDILVSTTAGTGFMHESFNCNDDYDFTRSWFAWANTLFAIFIIDCIEEIDN